RFFDKKFLLRVIVWPLVLLRTWVSANKYHLTPPMPTEVITGLVLLHQTGTNQRLGRFRKFNAAVIRIQQKASRRSQRVSGNGAPKNRVYPFVTLRRSISVSRGL